MATSWGNQQHNIKKLLVFPEVWKHIDTFVFYVLNMELNLRDHLFSNIMFVIEEPYGSAKSVWIYSWMIHGHSKQMSRIYNYPLKNQLKDVQRRSMQVLFSPASWWRRGIERFLYYWPFVRGIRRSPMYFPHERTSNVEFESFILCHRSKLLNNIPVACDYRRHGAHITSLQCSNKKTRE